VHSQAVVNLLNVLAEMYVCSVYTRLFPHPFAAAGRSFDNKYMGNPPPDQIPPCLPRSFPTRVSFLPRQLLLSSNHIITPCIRTKPRNPQLGNNCTISGSILRDLSQLTRQRLTYAHSHTPQLLRLLCCDCHRRQETRTTTTTTYYFSIYPTHLKPRVWAVMAHSQAED
jgi:hypothetical protein